GRLERLQPLDQPTGRFADGVPQRRPATVHAARAGANADAPDDGGRCRAGRTGAAARDHHGWVSRLPALGSDEPGVVLATNRPPAKLMAGEPDPASRGDRPSAGGRAGRRLNRWQVGFLGVIAIAVAVTVFFTMRDVRVPLPLVDLQD